MGARALAAAGWLGLMLLAADHPPADVSLVLLLAGAALLEATAGRARLSLAVFPSFAALALLGGFWAGWVWLAGALTAAAFGFTAAVLPTLAGLVAFQIGELLVPGGFLPWGAALLVYAFGLAALPDQPAGSLPPQLGAALLGLTAAPVAPLPLAAALAAVALLQVALGATAERREVADRLLLERKIEDVAEERSKAETRAREVRRNLDEKERENELLSGLGSQLLASRELGPTLSTLLASARGFTGARTTAIFLCEEGELVLADCLSPDPVDRDAARLRRATEPVVEKAWTFKTLQLLPEAGDLFPSEVTTCGLPLGEHGVLYLGFAGERVLEPAELSLLTVLANLGALGIRTALAFGETRQALEAESRARGHLADWSRGLDQVLELSRTLHARLNAEALLRQFQESLTVLVPHEGSALVDGQGRVVSSTGDLGEFEPLVRAVLEGQKPLLIESRQPGRLASPFPGHESLLAVPIPAEEQLVVLLSAAPPEAFSRTQRDLVALLSLQAGLALGNCRLHARVLEAYDQLKQSRAQLLQSSKLAAVGQLAAGIAHELNTPLGTVAMAIDFATPLLPEGEEREGLEVALSEIDRARDIIDKLLHYSRARKAGRKPVLMSRLVDDTVSLVGRQLRMSGVELTTQVDPDGRVFGNENELQQILINLLLNARDAAPEGQVHLTCRSRGERVELEIRDSGAGVPTELADSIFDPFFTTKPPGQGTGLGLSVSRELAEAHGGQLLHQGGSTFLLRLPATTSTS